MREQLDQHYDFPPLALSGGSRVAVETHQHASGTQDANHAPDIPQLQAATHHDVQTNDPGPP